MKRFPPRLQAAFDAFESGHTAAADALCRQIMTVPAPPPEVFFLLGLIANKTGRHPEAVEWLERAEGSMAPSVRLWSALGGAQRAAGHLDRAADYFGRCHALNPRSLAACLALGDVYYELRQMERAAPLYRQATELDPQNVEVWKRLANAYRNLCELDAALAAYDRALAICPDDPVAHANRGRTLLAAGRLPEGFREFEFRWEPMHLRRYQLPVWRGEPLPGKALFVVAEQGFGDTLHFVRFLPRARQLAGTVILECQPSLGSLLAHSRCADVIIAAGETPPPFDCYLPLLHLPSVFETNLETIPAAVPYLSTGATVTLPALPACQLKVGLAWAGNPAQPDDVLRSLPLAQMAGILAVPGASFFNLQWQIPARDQTFFHTAGLINRMDEVKDFAGTAALIEQLDLVICVDSAVAHLAGALGKPVWTVLSSPPDWRWLLRRPDSPWYPTMRLFRQQQPGAWEPVMAEVAAELRCRTAP
jgi:hypothetical protein